MMRVLSTLILLFPGFLLQAQHFRVEPQVNLLSQKQLGWIYTPIGTQSPPIGYLPMRVEQDQTAPGFGATVWYSMNFGTQLFQHMAYGVEGGFILNASTQDRSMVAPDKTYRWNIRLPIMAGIRLGSAIEPFAAKYGFGISGGMEMFRTAISNESGTYFIPKIQVIAGVRKVFIGLAFYPTSITSYYEIDGEVKDRITTSFFEFQVRTAINWFPKRYRYTLQHKKKGTMQ